MRLSILQYSSGLGLGPRCSLGSGAVYSRGLSLLIMLLPWMGLGDSPSWGTVQVLALAPEQPWLWLPLQTWP